MTATLVSLRDRVAAQLHDPDYDTWTPTELDEAIRQALDAYTAHLPLHSVSSITLTAAGREIDISSLTYTSIEHVWWDYDASDPDYPPKFRTFEVWPGDLLYITDLEEPASGDVVRIWYSGIHTLKDLDGAAATTLPDQHATLIAQGAAAFAVLARRVYVSVAVNDNEWAPRNLREWADARLADFYRHLDTLARQAAARAGGLAPGPGLDRWDGSNVW